MLAIGAVASVLGVALALLIDWFPVSASKQAGRIDTLYDVLLIVSVPVFVLVVVVVLFSVVRFRVRHGEELLDGPPIHGNTRVEIVWTAIPAMIIAGLCVYAYVVLHDIEQAKANEMVVNVTGEQFAWTFEYPAQKVKSTQLVLPEDKPVRFRVRAKDVIHSFWVPAFRMKKDAVPGITTQVRVTPTRLGNYPVVCAELCGLGHAAMRQTARVVTPTAFDTWLQDQKAPAPAAGGGGNATAAGRQVFTSTGCGACHALSDAGSTGAVGPNLDQAIKADPAATIKQAIVNPGAEIAKGYAANVMPANYKQTLSPQDLDALVQYLVKATHK